ncbi:hypothetical protein HC891_11040 [Candidatus Gracilibacteria bacterium]|nr:hypothetical protein [Candidatus Gracilibacteria bacterium]
MQYVGDTRLECLVTYVLSRDDRLPRKALRLFDASRLTSGLTQSRYPSRLRQIIPPFSLWWVCMLHDYLFWRDDTAFVRALLPGQRAVLDAFSALRGADGLVRSPQGWNYIDWVASWPWGEPPGAKPGAVCGPLNWQYVYALRRAAEVEAALGEPSWRHAVCGWRRKRRPRSIRTIGMPSAGSTPTISSTRSLLSTASAWRCGAARCCRSAKRRSPSDCLYSVNGRSRRCTSRIITLKPAARLDA